MMLHYYYYLFLMSCPVVLGWVLLPQSPERGLFHQRTSRLSEKDSFSSSVEGNPSSEAEAFPVIQEGTSLYRNQNPNLMQDEDGNDQTPGDVHIPSAGISVFDEMDHAQQDTRFVSDLIPLPGGRRGIAQIISSPLTRYSWEPLRYLVALSPPAMQKKEKSNSDDGDKEELVFVNGTFALVDVPPYSEALVTQMKAYMGVQHNLAAILVTSRDAIHYDTAQAVFSTRQSALQQWTRAFPNASVVVYRLDTPRDCQALVTQRLDGYGPFAAAMPTDKDQHQNVTFVETGRPLTYEEWDYTTAQKVLSGAMTPPDDNEDDANVATKADEEEKYTPQAIRAREQDKAILAIYTPGHSFGSLSYVFPQMQVCCSGFTLPVEDTRADVNEGFVDTGPALDVRGYITTSRAGIQRQMQSARNLVDTYYDRFDTILPSRGIPLRLGGSDVERRDDLLAIIGQYEKIGQIYESLGITSSSADDDEQEVL